MEPIGTNLGHQFGSKFGFKNWSEFEPCRARVLPNPQETLFPMSLFGFPYCALCLPTGSLFGSLWTSLLVCYLGPIWILIGSLFGTQFGSQLGPLAPYLSHTLGHLAPRLAPSVTPYLLPALWVPYWLRIWGRWPRPIWRSVDASSGMRASPTSIHPSRVPH